MPHQALSPNSGSFYAVASFLVLLRPLPTPSPSSGQTKAFHLNCWSGLPDSSYPLSFKIQSSLKPSWTAPELAGSQLGACGTFGCLHYGNYHSCVEICAPSRQRTVPYWSLHSFNLALSRHQVFAKWRNCLNPFLKAVALPTVNRFSWK